MVMFSATPHTLTEWWNYYMARAREFREAENYAAARQMINAARQTRRASERAKERAQMRWEIQYEIRS
jgi:hypothetical protein